MDIKMFFNWIFRLGLLGLGVFISYLLFTTSWIPLLVAAIVALIMWGLILWMFKKFLNW